MPVPLFDTATPLAPLRERIHAKLAEIADGGRYILGPEVEAFEREFASYLGARHAIGVANGTDALTIALRAMGVGPGDDVVVPSFTFYATAEAIPPTGARPVFCDVDPETMCVTAETVAAALTPRTKAVIAVHLFGNVAPVAEIEALGVPVLEDAAQAAGSLRDGRRAGALGTAATFSFFPSKNLGCLGDGGAVTTNDDEIAERVRLLRFHGSRDKVSYEEIGYNSRLDELQAACCASCCPSSTAGRPGAAAPPPPTRPRASARSPRCPSPTTASRRPGTSTSSATSGPTSCTRPCARRGIGSKPYYRVPLHRQPPLSSYAAGVELPPPTSSRARTSPCR